MKTLLGCILIFATRLAVGQPSSPETEKIKSCLIQVYSYQTAYQSRTGVYGEDLNKIGLSKSPKCKGIKLHFSKITDDTFTVVATAGGSSWSVDDSKLVSQIQ